MSLSPTATIKLQITSTLGSNAGEYFSTLQLFIGGRISRTEFEDIVRQFLDTPNLIQLHNSLIISLFDASAYKRPPTPPPDMPKPPPRKRRRMLPYQGPNDTNDSLLSSRLKRWSVYPAKRERDRIKALASFPRPLDSLPLRLDEISRERGVELLNERGDPPGSRLPLSLAAITRSPTLQHISDRLNLISAQHNLGAPSRAVASLMMLAFEAKLKQMITQALTLTSTSQAIPSITPSSAHSSSHLTHRPPRPTLSISSFVTLFTVAPWTLPTSSAAATRLLLSPDDESILEDSETGLEREVLDQRWQMFALLGERSTVKEALRSVNR